MSTRLLTGHVIDVLRALPPASVEVCCTSPPYHGLRSYGTEPQVWDAAEGCPHEWGGTGTRRSSADTGSGLWKGGKPRLGNEFEASTGAFCALCGAWRGELGLEPTADLYLAHLVGVFREVRRVLTPWATCWVNLGDSYSGGKGNRTDTESTATWHLRNGRRPNAYVVKNPGERMDRKPEEGFPAGSLCQIPARFALAMQQDGWLLRSAIVLAKASPMPESVSGWRHERCRVKVKASTVQGKGDPRETGVKTWVSHNGQGAKDPKVGEDAKWADCPGCARCEKSDGLVLRRGSWRPTSAYEMLYLFAKGPGYFCDGDAVRNPHKPETAARYDYGFKGSPRDEENAYGDGFQRNGSGPAALNPNGANARNVLQWKPQPLSDAHYAAYPPFIPEFALRAGASAWGVCGECRAPWARVVRRDGGACESEERPKGQGRDRTGGYGSSTSTLGIGGGGYGEAWAEKGTKTETLGWRATCSCRAERVPAVALDCFGGSGTTAMVADRLGHDAISIDLQPTYVDIARKRLHADQGLFAEIDG